MEQKDFIGQLDREYKNVAKGPNVSRLEATLIIQPYELNGLWTIRTISFSKNFPPARNNAYGKLVVDYAGSFL